jgi:hypothetical protein
MTKKSDPTNRKERKVPQLKVPRDLEADTLSAPAEVTNTGGTNAGTTAELSD